MAWIKRNLALVIGIAVSLLLLVGARPRWAELLSGIQQVLAAAATNHGIKLATGADGDGAGGSNDVIAAVWIERMEINAGAGGAPARRPADMAMDPFGGGPPIAPFGGGPPMTANAAGGQPGSAGVQREIGFLNLTLTALNLKQRCSPSANREFIEVLQTNFQSVTNLFLPAGTTLTNQIVDVDLTNHTFSFSVTLQLKDVFRH